MKLLGSQLVGYSALVWALSVAPAAYAQAAYSFDLPSQSLEASLQAVGSRTGTNIVFDTRIVMARRAPALRGAHDAEGALRFLLQGSGLSLKKTKGGSFVIRRTQTAQLARASREVQTADGQGFRDVSSSAPSPTEAESQPGTVSPAGDADVESAAQSEEIVVTAQRREERLQDVPISITVLGGRELDQSSASGVAEALSMAAGVSISQNHQTGGSQISIRGVAAPNAITVGSSPVAFYLDTVPFGFVKTAITPDASAYDLDRVEVLRGPQGTLYGASAQNGVVRVLTKDANLEEIEFKGRTAVADTRYGGTDYRGDAALNLPIAPGKLALRAVIGYQNMSGWIDKPNDKGANDAEILNLRLKINAEPVERFTVGASAWVSRSNFGAPSAGDDNRMSRSLVDESIDTDFNSYGMKLGYEFDSATLTSTTSYLEFGIDSRLDAVPAATRTNVLTTNLDAKMFAQEIYLSSDSEGAWRWSVGGSYRKANDRLFQIRRNQITGGLAGGYQAPLDVKFFSESYAVFGEVTRRFMDGRLELTGGLRYFEDEVRQNELSRLTVVGGVPATGLIRTQRKFSKFSPRAVLAWNPSNQFTAYASYAEGFRSGSDQLPTVVFALPTIEPAESDNLKNYEIGAKGSVLGGHIMFDAALYYMDWQRVQTPLIVVVGGVNQATVLNGTSASGFGLDFGLTAKPIDPLTLSFNFSVNDLTQDADVRSGAFLVFRKGERLNLSPKYTIGGSAQLKLPLGSSGYKWTTLGSINYTSSRARRLFNITGVTVNDKSLLLASARVGIESPDGWTLSLYGDNLLNEQDPVVGIPAGGVPEQQTRLRPRTIGAQLDFRF